MRNRFVIGNWKLNGSLASNASLLNALKIGVAGKKGSFCGVCAPFPYLAQVQAALGGSIIGWGAQDVSRFETGAYTGDVSAGMVAEFGSRHTLVGHSERRAIFGDTDEVVVAKFGQALKANLTPILCLGESLAERESGNTGNIVWRQLQAIIDAHGVKSLSKSILAYEPVWAIGTGKTAGPAQAEEVHAFLRGRISALDAAVGSELAILYGGSVKKSNAAELFGMPNIDGGLIGGASLVAEDFLGIWNAL
ncbi:MAG: triose-phosphate isomerase [Usitatibacteraceae bacterium]